MGDLPERLPKRLLAFAKRATRERLPGAPGIQINVPAIPPNALPPSYRAWGALFTIAKAHLIHKRLEEVVARQRNDNI